MKILTRAALAVLIDLHPAGEVRGAIWTLYLEAPGLLSEDVFTALEKATAEGVK